MAGNNETQNDFSGWVGGHNTQIGVNYGPYYAGGERRRTDKQERLRLSLAWQVRSASDRELGKWGIRDRDALPVRWHAAPGSLVDHSEKIHGNADPVPLDGQFMKILDTYEAVPSKRLVILGDAGAGKTVLAHRLILGLLQKREYDAGPVPVLFSLGGWNPAKSELPHWLAQQLAQGFPYLEKVDSTTKAMQAAMLVEGGFILPILDGFDEIPKGHHPAAIRQIGTLDRPLIVTSRLNEYAAAARGIKAVSGAAAITLEPLTLNESRDYLCRTTSTDRAPNWEAVFEHIRIAPDEIVSQNLTSVLSTPLMIVLARTVYNDTATLTPLDLLDSRIFPTDTIIEDHLLAQYITTVYSQRDTGPGRPRRPNWNPDRVRHWLGYLATHLQQRDTYDLTWWHLPATLNRVTRILVVTTTLALISVFVTASTGNINFGLILGLAFGVSNEIKFTAGNDGGGPVRLRLRLFRKGSVKASWSPAVYLAKSRVEFVAGFAAGMSLACMFWIYDFASRGFSIDIFESFFYGFPAGFIFFSLIAPVHGCKRAFFYSIPYIIVATKGVQVIDYAGQIAIGTVVWPTISFGALVGIVTGFANLALAKLGEYPDPKTVITSWDLLVTDRRAALVRAIAVAPIFGLVIGVTLGPVAGIGEVALAISAVGGILGGITSLMLSSWWNWLLFTRLWLPLSGRLPWRPKRFILDANDRGVLRTTGVVYQFRHARLRDHLAERYRT